MVTVRNDIEMVVTAAPGGMKVKDVNLKQEAKPARRRSYRCIIIVGVVTSVLLLLAVGSILLFEYVPNEVPVTNSGDDGSTLGPEEAPVHQQSVPAFADPYDGMPSQPNIDLDPADNDDGIDIDATTAALPTTTTTATTTEVDSIVESSGDDDSDYYSSGSGSGEDDLY